MSGGGNNATISMPGRAGHPWGMLWPYTFGDFQLDIVGFLAILGEGSVAANAQVSALSRLFYLPRLIPAPQALLWPIRPTSLSDTTAATVTGVYSGNVKEHVHHVASILIGEEMKTFTVRCVHVVKKKRQMSATRLDVLFRGQPSNARADTMSPEMGPPSVKAKATGPLAYVALLGFSISLALFILSVVFGDGMSTLATILLSLLSTLVGFVNKWSLRLPRKPPGVTPPGDVVIRYPNGSYLVVLCEEEVARELFFAPEEIDYNIKSDAVYRLISLVGTLMLMLGVIALANARLELQFAWAGAYILVNAAHWVAAALPPRLHWDLSCYEVQEQGVVGGPRNKSFTDALWKAIIFTKSKRWAKNGKAAPQTDDWDEWLIEAEAQAQQVGNHIGEIQDPIWPVRDPKKATIWDVPENWKAKEAWNRINDRNTSGGREEGETSSVRAA